MGILTHHRGPNGDYQELPVNYDPEQVAGVAALEIRLEQYGARRLLGDTEAVDWQRNFRLHNKDLNGNGVIDEPRGAPVRSTLRDLKTGVDRV